MKRFLSTTIVVGMLLSMLAAGSIAGGPTVEESKGPPSSGQQRLAYSDYLEVAGDGHMHTSHSTGVSTTAEMAAKARERNLDWIFITDSNRFLAKEECENETNETFVCGMGQQVSTGTNDIIGWGLDEYVYYYTNETRTVETIINEIHKQGGLAYLPHPCAPEEDDNYDYFGVYDDWDGLGIFHGYSGFNEVTTPMDADAVDRWDEYLSNGWRKVGLGESDCKDAANTYDQGDLWNQRGAIGYPRNYLYAQELSVRGLIEAARHGRCYVSDGPTMDFTIDGNIMGDVIQSTASTQLTMWVNGTAVESSDVRIITNGGSVIHTESVPAGPFSVSYQHTANADAYFRAEVRTFNAVWLSKGETNIAFANPVYFDLSPYEEAPLPPTEANARVEGGDIVLNWTASASSDVIHYNVYRSTTRNGFNFSYPYAITCYPRFRDKGAGDGDPNDYFYIVRSVDKMLLEDGNADLLAKHVSALNEGWNLVSTPLENWNVSTGYALQTVSDTLDVAEWYDASNATDQWKDTVTGDLLAVDHTMGLWLRVNAADSLVTAGRVRTSTDIPLYAGWNLVSYPSYTGRAPALALAGTSWDAVQTCDATLWSDNCTARPGYVNDLAGLTHGKGYWVRVTGNCTWTVPG